ncbi:MAG: hypothetical protein ACPK85_10770 [Methanosarcina sp.]
MDLGLPDSGNPDSGYFFKIFLFLLAGFLLSIRIHESCTGCYDLVNLRECV